MRKIALDVGDKTIGVAISDQTATIAQGLTTIDRVGIRKDTNILVDLIKEYQCDVVVLGLPRNMDGTEGQQSMKVREFADFLRNKLRSSGLSSLEMVFQDERLTTIEAERVLIDADLSRKQRKTVIDKQAAILILQSYLESNRSREKKEHKEGGNENE